MPEPGLQLYQKGDPDWVFSCEFCKMFVIIIIIINLFFLDIEIVTVPINN